jgi:hypothetical protein
LKLKINKLIIKKIMSRKIAKADDYQQTKTTEEILSEGEDQN